VLANPDLISDDILLGSGIFSTVGVLGDSSFCSTTGLEFPLLFALFETPLPRSVNTKGKLAIEMAGERARVYCDPLCASDESVGISGAERADSDMNLGGGGGGNVASRISDDAPLAVTVVLQNTVEGAEGEGASFGYESLIEPRPVLERDRTLPATLESVDDSPCTDFLRLTSEP
jgi:hypothetical protein